MTPRPLEPGEIVQISPTAGRGVEWFGACLMVVTEPKPWGAQGYVKSPGNAGIAYYRCKFEEMEPTGGRAPWFADPEAEPPT